MLHRDAGYGLVKKFSAEDENLKWKAGLLNEIHSSLYHILRGLVELIPFLGGAYLKDSEEEEYEKDR